MKKLLVILTTLAFVVGFSTVSFAAITGSAHDFQSNGWSGGEICVVCHTPHNAMTITDAPLWNHTESTVTSYTLYSSSTLNAVPGQPTGVSKLCLACHDGSVAIDAFGLTPGSTVYITDFAGRQVGDASGPGGTTGSLAQDHPVSFAYNAALATADGELVTPTDATTVEGTLPLFSASVECATCHDVHATGTVASTPLLRITNAGSAICLACHTK